ncbi:hypothetical protein F5Y12DRAFT_783300 [Xylaria sp. FL1777]|nr:hypothetical protein F5Y12DRAFT_783300 [Xylaria sp. FL1777]
MEWISQKKRLLDADLAEFSFDSGYPCLIQTIRLQRDSSGRVQIIDEKSHTSEQEYLEWLKNLPSCLDGPSVVLVMHQRLETDNPKATRLPYGKETFRQACEQLYQHRSVANAIRRKSTAIFTSCVVAPWKSKPEWGSAVVYNCKSDTESLAPNDDMVLSVTHFPVQAMMFGVFYGCTRDTREFISDWFKFIKASAFDPLLLPMIFVECERTRLLNKLERKGGDLYNRIIDMENRLKQDAPGKSGHSSDLEKDRSNRNITQRECEAVNLWVDVSALKNGLESLKTELTSMLQFSKEPLENKILGSDPLRHHSYIPARIEDRNSCSSIQARIHDIIVEIESRIRRTQGVLVGMSLATQTESNYITRKDAWATISIAVESKKDSSHMRYISFLGMIFLPGTFFATLFSMGFFNWIPDQSGQKVSPWVAVYFVVTIFSTIATVWRFKEWAKKQDLDATLVYAQLDNGIPPVPLQSMGPEIV